MIQPIAESLENIGVLVTRPAHQNQAFIQLLQAAGAHPVAFPSIEIRQPRDLEAAKSRIDQLGSYHILIFISTNAVHYGVDLIQQMQKSIIQAVSAVGKSTALALHQQGIRTDLQPESGFNSEALLEMAAFQTDNINGKRILIFRGQGGRELLANTLKTRGASVDYAEVYERIIPESDFTPVLDLCKNDRIQVITVPSNESQKNLYDMAGEKGRTYLCNTPLFVPGERCAELAQQLGFKSILQATSAMDQAMLERIRQWHKKALE